MNRPPSTPTNQDPKCKPWAQHDEQTRLSSPQTDLNRQTSPQARNNGWGPLTQDPSYKPSGRMQQTSNRSSPRYPPEPTNRNSLAPSSSWQSEDRTRPHPNDTNKQDTAKSNQRWRSSQQSSNDHTRPIPNDTNKQETAKFSQPWEGRLRSDYRPVNEQSQRQNYRPAPRQQQHSPPTSSQAPIRKDVPSKTDEDELLKSMQALSTNDQPDTMADDDYVLECKASPLKMDQIETTFGRYETMRGGCRFQSMDGTTALVIFGHPSTAKRAWAETKHSTVFTIRSYKGPMDIIEDVPIVRKSTLNQRPRPTNLVAQRLIHGSLGLKRPTHSSPTKQ